MKELDLIVDGVPVSESLPGVSLLSFTNANLLRYLIEMGY